MAARERGGGGREREGGGGREREKSTLPPQRKIVLQRILHNGGSRASLTSTGSRVTMRVLQRDYYFLHCHSCNTLENERERERERKRCLLTIK